MSTRCPALAILEALGRILRASIYYFHAFYFKRFNSISLKLLSADGMFIFISGVWSLIKFR